jgi:hypothetical protein
LAANNDSIVPASVHQPSNTFQVNSPACDIGIVDVRDFEFTASGRLQRPGNFKHACVVKVDPRHRVRGLGMRRFLFNAEHPIPFKIRDTEPLRIFHFLEKNLGALLLGAKCLRRFRDIALN